MRLFVWPETPGSFDFLQVNGRQRSAPLQVHDLASLVFFHPDYTVGPGVTPGQRPPKGSRSRTIPPVGELHPTLKTKYSVVSVCIIYQSKFERKHYFHFQLTFFRDLPKVSAPQISEFFQNQRCFHLVEAGRGRLRLHQAGPKRQSRQGPLDRTPGSSPHPA